MQVLALIESAGHVCFRYRIEAFAEALSARGIHLESQPLSSSVYGRMRQVRAAADADVVILQRKLLPLWQLRLVRKAAKRLIYDYDDAVFQRDSYSSKRLRSWTRLGRFWATVYAADLILAGNDYLAERAAQYAGNSRVAMLPTCVRHDRYAAARHQRRGGVHLVWIGQASTLPSLNQAQECLAAAAAAAPGAALRVICDRPAPVSAIPVLAVPWASETEATELAAADIGVSWLPDDPWSLGKCGLKVLQYMAAGLPVVGNPVGMNRELITPGVTGYLAATPREWGAAIEQLAFDPVLRGRMGAAARSVVASQYSVARWAPRFVELIAGSPAISEPRVVPWNAGEARRFAA